MATLNNNELSKFRNGEYRWAGFVRKMDANEEFTLSPRGKELLGKDTATIRPVDNTQFRKYLQESLETGHFDSLSSVKFRDKETDIIIGLTALEKTKEFGSSKGLGGGSVQTAYVESKIARLCAEKAGGVCYSSLDESTDFNVDESWESSFTDSVDAIVSSPLTAKLPDYHYQDDLVGWIGDTYKKCKKGSSFATRNINKWNPADIWCSSGDVYTISSSLSVCQTLPELNSVCYGSNLKGISLKKGGITVKEVNSFVHPWKVEKWEILNKEKWVEASSLRCVRIRFNLEGGPDKLLTVRADGTKFRAEVKTIGSDHRNGGCGYNQLNGCLDENRLDFRFTSLQNIPNESRGSVANYRLRCFIEALGQCKDVGKLIADIVRRCTCQSRGHCTYLKVS